MESPVSERPGPEEQLPPQVQAVHFQGDAMQTHDVPTLSTLDSSLLVWTPSPRTPLFSVDYYQFFAYISYLSD